MISWTILICVLIFSSKATLERISDFEGLILPRSFIAKYGFDLDLHGYDFLRPNVAESALNQLIELDYKLGQEADSETKDTNRSSHTVQSFRPLEANKVFPSVALMIKESTLLILEFFVSMLGSLLNTR